MKVNVKFSQIERSAPPEVAPEKSPAPLDQKGEPKEAKISPVSDKTPSQSADKEPAPAKTPASPEQTTRLSLDDLKKQQTRRSGLWIGLLILALLITAGGVAWYFLGGHREQRASAQAHYNDFTVAAYLANPPSLAGNRYQARMRVDSQLGSSQDSGRLLVFKEMDSDKPLAVLVPASLDKINLEKGQLLQVRFLIRDGGLIYVEDIQKP